MASHLETKPLRDHGCPTTRSQTRHILLPPKTIVYIHGSTYFLKCRPAVVRVFPGCDCCCAVAGRGVPAGNTVAGGGRMRTRVAVRGGRRRGPLQHIQGVQRVVPAEGGGWKRLRRGSAHGAVESRTRDPLLQRKPDTGGLLVKAAAALTDPAVVGQELGPFLHLVQNLLPFQLGPGDDLPFGFPLITWTRQDWMVSQYMAHREGT